MLWDKDTQALMVEMWNNGGLTASDIARRLGKGLTRNSVVAKAWRLRGSGVYIRARGFENNGAKKKKKQGKLPVTLLRRVRVAPKPKPATQLEMAMRAVSFKPAQDDTKPAIRGVHELEAHHCRWPIGTPGEADFGFCGADRFMALSYCPKHCAMGYQAPSPVRAQAQAAIAQEPRSHDLVLEDA